MTDTTHILLLGDDTPMRPMLWNAGAETSLICDTEAARTHRSISEHQSVMIVDRIDVQEAVEVAMALHRSRPVSRAVGVDDTTMVAAAAINEALSVPNVNSVATAAAALDKPVYRRRLVDAGFDSIRGTEAATADDVIAFGDAVGWPIVVKPAIGSGSTGASVGVTREGARGAWARAHRRSRETPSGRVAVEQQAYGRVLTVDTHSHRGIHRLVMVGFELVALERPVVVMTGAPAPIPADDWEKAVEATFGALSALGVVDGPAHTELILMETGPVLIETQLRLGGDFPQLTRASTGLDPYRLCVAGWIGGDPLELLDEAAVAPRNGLPSVMLWGGPHCPGDYLSRTGLPTEDSEGVGWVREIGLPPRRSGRVETLDDLPVGALVTARSHRQATAKARRALASVRFRVAPDTVLPIAQEVVG